MDAALKFPSHLSELVGIYTLAAELQWTRDVLKPMKHSGSLKAAYKKPLK